MKLTKKNVWWAYYAIYVEGLWISLKRESEGLRMSMRQVAALMEIEITIDQRVPGSPPPKMNIPFTKVSSVHPIAVDKFTMLLSY